AYLTVTPWRSDGGTLATEYSFSEGNSGTVNQVIALSRSGNLASATVVNWKLGTIVPDTDARVMRDADFVATAGAVTFAAGQTQGFLTVQVKGDTIPEADEYFYVGLGSANGLLDDPRDTDTAYWSTVYTGWYVVRNDDVIPSPGDFSLGFENTAGAKLEGGAVAAEAARPATAGATPFVFTVRRSSGLSDPYTLDWHVDVSGWGNHATADDFAGATAGEVVFTAGQTAAQVTVLVKAEFQFEGDEWFGLALTDPLHPGNPGIPSNFYVSIDNDDDFFIGAASATVAGNVVRAVPMAVGSSFAGSRTRIDFAGDQDWMQVELAQGQIYEFLVYSDTGFTPAVKVVASNGTTQVTAGVTGGTLTGVGSYVDIIAPTSGTYYVAVSGAGTGGYAYVSMADATLDDYADNFSTTAVLVPDFAGTDRHGRFQTAFDSDVMQVYLEAGQTYHFGADVVGGAGQFTLYDSFGVTVDTDFSGFPVATGVTEYSISGFAATSGVYYLEIANQLPVAGGRWAVFYDGQSPDPFTIPPTYYGVEAVAPNVYEGDTGQQMAYFNVFRTGGTDQGGTVEWRIHVHGDDILGTSGNDSSVGSQADDIFWFANQGDDTLVGGAGDDVAEYFGYVADFSIVTHGDGSVTVTDNEPVFYDEGTDLLSGIEYINFFDKTYRVIQGGEGQVNTHTIDDQDYPDITRLADGGWVIAWQSYGQDYEADEGVFFQRYAANGTAVGGETQANTYVQSDQMDVTVAGLQGGGWVVLWESWNEDGYQDGVFGQVYDVDGNVVGSEFQANVTTDGDQDNASVTVLADGNFVVAWDSAELDGFSEGTVGRLFDTDGTPLSGEFQISPSEGDSRDKNPRIAALADGGFAATFDTYDAGGGLKNVGMRLFNADGTTRTPVIPVNQETANDQWRSAITSLAGGNFVVAWESLGQDGDGYGVYARLFNAGGAALGNEFRLNQETFDDQDTVAVAALTDGGFVAAWSSYGQDGDYWGVFARRFDAAGNPVDDEFQVNVETFDYQDYPVVTGTADGGFNIAWESWGQDGSAYGIFSRRFDAQGKPIGNPYLQDAVLPETPTVSLSDFAPGAVLAGTATFAAGQAATVVSVGVAGDMFPESDEAFRVDLLASAGTTLATGYDSATSVIRDDDAYGTISLYSMSSFVNEGGSYSVVLSRDGGLRQSSVVTWKVAPPATSPGSFSPAYAAAADFAGGVLPGGTLTFAPGETLKTFSLATLNDAFVEATESFALDFSVSRAYYDSEGNVTGTEPGFLIGNDDGSLSASPTFTIATYAAGQFEGGSIAREATPPTATGATPYVFTIARSGTTAATTVNWKLDLTETHLGRGNHLSISDLAPGQAIWGEVGFSAGQTAATVTVNIAADYANELNEYFSLLIYNSAGTRLDAASYRTVTVFNDDDRFVGTSTAVVGATTFTPAAFVIGTDRIGSRTRIDFAADQDWYAVRLNAGERYEFWDVGRPGGIDPSLRLLDASGVQVATGANSFTAFDHLAYTAPVSGLYYLAAAANAGFSTAATAYSNQYAIVSRTPGELDDFDSGIATLDRLASSNYVPGTFGRIDYVGDEDAFKTRLDSGSTYTWILAGIAPESGGGDLTFSFYDGVGTPLASTTAAATAAGAWMTASAAFTYSPAVSGDYVMAVTGSNGALWHIGLDTVSVSGGLSSATPTVYGLQVPGTVVEEGDGNKFSANLGVHQVFVNVYRTGPSNLPGSVDWSVVGFLGDVNASDFVLGQTGGVVNFGAGEAYQTLTLLLMGDDVDEGDEGFHIELSNPLYGGSAAAVNAGDWSDDVYIKDDDLTVFAVAGLEAAKYERNGGPTNFVYLISRSGSSDAGATVRWFVSGGVNGTDFVGEALPAGTLTFGAGETARFVTVQVQGDSSVEVDESFSVFLGSAFAGSGAAATIDPIAYHADSTIRNDDGLDAEGGADSLAAAGTATARITAVPGTTTVLNGSISSIDPNDYFKVVLPTAANLTVHLYGMAGGDANLRLVRPGGVPLGVSSNPGDQDDLLRFAGTNTLAAGTYFVHVQAAAGDTDYRLFLDAGPASAVPPYLLITSSAAERLEGNTGATPFVFTVMRGGNVASASSVGWVVQGSTAGAATAAAGSDFVGGNLPSGTVAFAPGVSVMLLTINVAGDTTDHVDEGFAVVLTTAVNGTIVSTGDVEAVIRDDDLDPDFGANTIAGIGTGSFTASDLGYVGHVPVAMFGQVGLTDPNDYYRIRLAGDADLVIQLQGMLGDANVDLLDASGNLLASSTNPGRNNERIVFTGATAGTYLVRAYSQGGADTAYDLEMLAVPPRSVVRIATGSVPASEGNAGSAAYVFNVTRSGDVSEGGSVEWRITSPTPSLSGADFAGGTIPSGTVSFAASQSVAAITVLVAGDTDVEPDENFAVELLNPFNVSLHPTQRTAGAVIVNDDRIVPPPSLLIQAPGTAAFKDEGNSGATTSYVFTVQRSGDADQLATGSAVNWAVAGLTPGLEGNDFVGGVLPSGVVNFAAGETAKSITIAVAGDNTVERDDPFQVRLTGADWGVMVGGGDVANALIRNDDIPPASAVVALRRVEGSSSQAEGNAGSTDFTFQVVRTGGDPAAAVTVGWRVDVPALGGASLDDFAGGVLPTGSVLLAAGETAATITVQIKGDVRTELDETFLVRLTDASGGVIDPLGAVASGLVVNDDLVVRFGVAADSPAQAEGNAGDTTAFSFTVTRSGILTGTADTVQWSVVGLGAGAADFDGGLFPSGTVTFAAGETMASITVSVAGDVTVEGNELFAVALLNPVADTTAEIDPLAVLAPANILNDDGATPEVGIVAVTRTSDAADAPYGVTEGDSSFANMLFQITRSGANLGSATVVRWSVAGAL
ncbi:MAG TPA: Calx-beta domain-containing protein, partial [Rhodocyclaceae bacterium]|nr:Calx-beta domain-containing protein [Rhodocyclaceae bacterium]